MDRQEAKSRNFKRLYLVHFSPSGSTEKILRRVASGISGLEVETINLLPSANRKGRYVFGEDDLVLYGSLSAGMLFTKAEECFACLRGNQTPFIGLITYGNGYYGVALTEMKERAESRGFVVSALAAFISRHSMSNSLAADRPDEKDEATMVDFGRRAYEKILAGDLTLRERPATNWPRDEKFKWVVEFREKNKEPYALPASCKTKTISDACVKCGTCVRNCPGDAIDIETKTFDLDACVGCWGCINRCPKRAVTSTSAEVEAIMKDFTDAFKNERLEPDIFM